MAKAMAESRMSRHLPIIRVCAGVIENFPHLRYASPQTPSPDPMKILKVLCFMALGAVVMIGCLLWMAQFFNLEDDTIPVIWLDNSPVPDVGKAGEDDHRSGG